jgi:hypothetical protein
VRQRANQLFAHIRLAQQPVQLGPQLGILTQPEQVNGQVQQSIIVYLAPIYELPGRRFPPVISSDTPVPFRWIQVAFRVPLVSRLRGQELREGGVVQAVPPV